MTRFLPADINELRDAVGEALVAEEPLEVLAGGSKASNCPASSSARSISASGVAAAAVSTSSLGA